VKPLRRRILALLGAVAILLGLLVPAAALPCAGGEGSAMSCDVCLVGTLPGAPVCASACPAVPAPEPAAAVSSPGEPRAWFANPAARAYGLDPSPDSPPPR
jgi:hypothetical protein